MSMFMGFALPMMPPGVNGSAQYLNDVMVMDIFNRITNIALSRFKWSNLPDTCDARALEMTLYFYGKCLFFYDPDFGLMHTPFTPSDAYNIYYIPTERNAYSFNYNKRYSIDDSVIIRNNLTQTPDFYTVWNYTPRIADGIRAIDVHTNTLKRPFLMYCSEKDRNTYMNILKNISDNEIAIFGRKFNDANGIGSLNVADKSYLPDFWANVKNYLGQVYSSLGIKNSFTEKRERMIVSEVEGEGNAIRHTLESALQSRKEACNQINAMFSDYLPQPISVEANEIEVFNEEILERDTPNDIGGGDANNVSDDELS